MKHILQRILVSPIQRISWFEPTYYTRECVLSGQGRFVDAPRSICSGGYLLLPHLLGSDVGVTIKRRRLSYLGIPGFICSQIYSVEQWQMVFCAITARTDPCGSLYGVALFSLFTFASIKPWEPKVSSMNIVVNEFCCQVLGLFPHRLTLAFLRLSKL